jgi:uncharacterized membrane protein
MSLSQVFLPASGESKPARVTRRPPLVALDLPPIGGMREDEAMGLKFIAVVALLSFGVMIARRLGQPTKEGNPFPRSVLNIVLLSLVLGVAGSLFLRFAFRSGNAALMLVAAMSMLTLAVALGWYVTRATSADRRRHHRPPRE